MFIPNQSWPIAYQYDEPENCLAKAVDTDSMPAVGKKVAELMNATIRTTSAGGENDSSQVKYDSQDLLKQAKSLQKLSSSTNTMLIWIASISLLVGGTADLQDRIRAGGNQFPVHCGFRGILHGGGHCLWTDPVHQGIQPESH